MMLRNTWPSLLTRFTASLDTGHAQVHESRQALRCVWKSADEMDGGFNHTTPKSTCSAKKFRFSIFTLKCPPNVHSASSNASHQSSDNTTTIGDS
eukprot:1154739-Pelagomonas_calceolata.AAC.2